MAKILDFAKWTLTLAIALFFYLQQNFLPAGKTPLYWIVVTTMLVAGASALLGIALYGRATKVLAQNSEATFDPMVQKLGIWHSGLLALAFAVAFGLFAWQKVLNPPAAPARCTLSTGEITLSFDCAAKVAETVAAGGGEVQ